MIPNRNSYPLWPVSNFLWYFKENEQAATLRQSDCQKVMRSKPKAQHAMSRHRLLYTVVCFSPRKLNMAKEISLRKGFLILC